jgi:hypothetical protein
VLVAVVVALLSMLGRSPFSVCDMGACRLRLLFWQPMACAVGLDRGFSVMCLKQCQILGVSNLINLIAWARSEPSCGADGFDLLFPLVCDAPDQCWCSSCSCLSQRKLNKHAFAMCWVSAAFLDRRIPLAM